MFFSPFTWKGRIVHWKWEASMVVEKLRWEKISLRNVLLCFPFPFPSRSQCCKLVISFSNCLHMVLLRNFSPHLLRAGWCRGICWLPCLACSCKVTQWHVIILGWYLRGRRGLKHLFWKGCILFLCSVSQVPAGYGRKHSRMDLNVTIRISQIIVTDKSSQHSCSYSMVNCML